MVSEKLVLQEALDLVLIDQLVNELKPYRAHVTLSRHGYEVDAKNAIRLMELQARAGESVTVICRGRDEAACLAAAVSLLR